MKSDRASAPRKLLRDLPDTPAGRWLARLLTHGKRVEGRGVTLCSRRGRQSDLANT